MTLTVFQSIATILAIAFGAILTRVLPFFIFPENKKVPKFIKYLGKVLPCATMGLLVVYCFKDVDITSLSAILPQIIAVASVVITHLLKKNTLLSIFVGTAVYMILVQFIF
ncbi:MAG: AzlD domain-containing protein [Oscillospiraceae bacterium]